MKIEKGISKVNYAPAYFVGGFEFETRSKARAYIRSVRPKKPKVPRSQGEWGAGIMVDGVPLNVALEKLVEGVKVRRSAE